MRYLLPLLVACWLLAACAGLDNIDARKVEVPSGPKICTGGNTSVTCW